MAPGALQFTLAAGALAASQVVAALGAELHDSIHRKRSGAAVTAERSHLGRVGRWLDSSTLPRWRWGILAAARWRGSKPEIGLRLQDLGYDLGIEVQYSPLMPLKNLEIRVRAGYLGRELVLDLSRFCSGQPLLPSVEPDEGDLILFAALDL
jgi:hypothetical protein